MVREMMSRTLPEHKEITQAVYTPFLSALPPQLHRLYVDNEIEAANGIKGRTGDSKCPSVST